MTKLLLSGYFGFDNAGDEAILASTLSFLTKHGIGAIVLSGNPERTKTLHNVDSIHYMKPFQILKALKECNGVVSGGGSLFQDKTSSKSFYYYLFVLKIAHLFNKPTFILSQGIGPILKKQHEKMLKKTFNQSSYLSVRDESSKQLLERIGVKNKIELSVDNVFNFNRQLNTDLPGEIKHFLDHHPVVISIRPWDNTNHIKTKIKQLILNVISNNERVLLLPLHGSGDHTLACEIKKELALSDDRLCVPGSRLDFHDAIDVIHGSKLVIGMRLHALIFAAKCHIPFIGISYDPKIDAFLKLYNKRTVSTANNLSPTALLDEVNRLLYNWENEVRLQKNITTNLEKKARQPLEAILDYYTEAGEKNE